MSPPKRIQRCAIYTRKSTEEGLEQEYNSLHAQRDACEAYVKSQTGEGWILIKTIYDDGGFSGGSMERPALQALLNDIDSGKIDVVVVYKVDRLTRSLTDFSKIVDRFDKRSVSFVSVTQSFNTTNSMGRLTLNVLLSFAQFEREVAGERIRDKIGASRRKGMWMGGSVPTGYDVLARKLVPNPEAAEKVREIFQRYVEIKSIQLLRLELKDKGVTSQVRVHESGRQRGGHPFSRGALTHLLKNRVYVGEVFFKGAIYPGQHDSIVDRKLFDRAQAVLDENRRLKIDRPTTRLQFPLTGLLFDDQGHPMSPSHTRKNAARRYRYYVSRALIDKDRGQAGSIPRVPAQPIDDIVLSVLKELRPESARPDATDGSVANVSASLSGLQRVEIGSSTIKLYLNAKYVADFGADTGEDTMTALKRHLGSNGRLEEDGDQILFTMPIRARFRGGAAIITAPGLGSMSKFVQPDRTLLKTIVLAHSWMGMVSRGDVRSVEELARHVKRDCPYVRRVLKLAFLSPTITQGLLDGSQPAHLTATDLLEADIPLNWTMQAALMRV